MDILSLHMYKCDKYYFCDIRLHRPTYRHGANSTDHNGRTASYVLGPTACPGGTLSEVIPCIQKRETVLMSGSGHLHP